MEKMTTFMLFSLVRFRSKVAPSRLAIYSVPLAI
jgi:hypothetical protein